MPSSGPIGVFDSGYGGLTVLRSLTAAFPEYDFVYYGDNARAPYGGRSFEVVYRYTQEAVKQLFELGAPLVILACNTASAKALRTIQQRDLPGLAPANRVLGVIRPSVEYLGQVSRGGQIGVVGTVGTVLSESYPLEIAKLYPDFKVVQEACPMWVPLIENQEVASEGAGFFVRQNLSALFSRAPETDTLILGCTHYPLLLPLIERFVPAGVEIIDQGPVVADRLGDYLLRHPEMDERLSRRGQIAFYTSEDPLRFNASASFFLGRDVVAQHLPARH